MNQYRPSNRTIARMILLSLVSLSAVAAADKSPFPGAGLRIVQDDIIVRDDLSAFAQARDLNARSFVIRSDNWRWQNGLIPYRIDPALSAHRVTAIERAIALWNDVAGIRLMEVGKAARETPAALANASDYLWFTTGDSCASWVGRQGGRQNIWVGEQCNTGSVMHEIGHAIGLRHEHNRPDRDQHVTVLWENILPEKQHNYAIDEQWAQPHGPYDLASIMHYGPTNFSIGNRAQTLVSIARGDAAMGQRLAPSTGDIASVNALYETDLALTLAGMPSNGGFEAIVSVLSEQGAQSLKLDIVSDVELQPDGESWDCSHAGSTTTCRLLQLPSGSQASLWVALPSGAVDVTAEIRSGNSDTNVQNNRDSLSLSVPHLAAAYADESNVQVDEGVISQQTLANDGGSGGGGSAGAGSASLLLLLLAAAATLRRGSWRHDARLQRVVAV